MKSRIWLAVLAVTLAALLGRAQETKPLYQNNFQNAEVGKVPGDFLVLDGAFAVEQDGTNKFLELPGAPLDNFGVLFGPTEKDDLAISARVYGTAKGRRAPVFAVGLNGVGGYRLQVSPAKKAVELYRGDTLKTSAAYDWKSGRWTHLTLQIQKEGSGIQVQGKVWSEGDSEPATWSIATRDKEDLPAGRASISGSPFSGTPIRYDDLRLERGGAK
jgi:hypothetical protein